jgi:sigma-B regulation protein RsbU (phosphoserine phosphatase)
MMNFPGFEYLYNHISCGIVTFQSSGKLIAMNQTLLNWTGLTEEEIPERTFNDLLDKGGKLYFQLFVQPLIKMNGKINEVSFNIQSRFDNFPCLFTAFVTEVGPDQEPIIVGTIFRILDRKKYESELLKAKVKSQEQEEIKTQSLAEVAYIQAHSVRAPLANILSLVSLLRDAELNESDANIVSMLTASAHRLDAVIKGIIEKTEI